MELEKRSGVVIEQARAQAPAKAGSELAVPAISKPVELDEGNVAKVSDIYKNLRDPRMPLPQQNRDRGHYFVRNRYR